MGLTATHKVYLIDEVHMLSANASNALLKTLEEPPEHVVFVLATTGPERVLPTIRSRTQHFEFTLYTVEELAGHLADVVRTGGGAGRPAGARRHRPGRGGIDPRRAVAARAGHRARAPGGRADRARCSAAPGSSCACASSTPSPARTSPSALVALGELLDAGHDPRRVTEDLLATGRDAFLLVSAKGRVRIDAPADHVERLDGFGAQVGPALLVRLLETLGQAVVDMRGTDAADPRLVLEIALVRLARRDAGPPLQVLVERIERIERTLADGGATRPAADPPAPGSAAPRAPRRAAPSGRAVRQHRRPPGRARPVAGGRIRPPRRPRRRRPPTHPSRAVRRPTIDLDDVVVAWAEILPSFSPATRAVAQDAQPIAYDAGVITFGIPAQRLKSTGDRFRTQADAIRAALSERLGGTMKFKLEPYDGFAGGSGPASGRPSSGGPRGGPAAGGPASAAPSSAAPSSAGAAGDDPPLGEAPPPDDDDEILDLSELVDAEPADTAGDSVAKFTESFDATVVEEVPRD